MKKIPSPIACIPNGVVVHRTVGSWSFTLTGGEDIYICNTKENTTGKDGQHFALSCVGQRIGLFKYAKGKLSPQVCFPAMEEIMQPASQQKYVVHVGCAAARNRTPASSNHICQMCSGHFNGCYGAYGFRNANGDWNQGACPADLSVYP